NGQYDDDCRCHARHFVDEPQGFVLHRPFAARQLFDIAHHPAVIARKHNNHQKLGMEPALAERTNIKGKRQTQYPGDDERGIEDDLAQFLLALDPFAVLWRAHSRFLMIDKETRHHEQPGHPEDNKDKLCVFQPEIMHGYYYIHCRTICRSCSTGSMGVSGKIPWPRLTIWGRSSNICNM